MKRYPRRVCAIIAGVASAVLAVADLPLPGPGLEAPPSLPSAPPAAVAAVSVPGLRPPRVLALLGKWEAAAAYERITARLGGRLELCYVGFGDGRYHVNDKWIEPKGDPTPEELEAAAQKTIRDAMALKDGGIPCDIVMTCNPPGILSDKELQARLRAYVEAGGILVVCGSHYPAADTPLGQVWPAKPGKNNSWMSGGAKRTDSPELTGVPVEHLAGHAWIPFAEVAEGARALATGETGAAFVRDLGKGHILFVPMGLISRKWDAMATLGKLYDHDEIWYRFWTQALTLLRSPQEQWPPLTRLTLPEKPVAAGTAVRVPVALSGGAGQGVYSVKLTVTDPQGRELLVREATVAGTTASRGSAPTTPAGGVPPPAPGKVSAPATAEPVTGAGPSGVPPEPPPGTQIDAPARVTPKDDDAASKSVVVDVAVPVGADWASGWYPVRATVYKAGAPTTTLHQALDWLQVTGALALKVVTDKPGYQVGETATVRVEAQAASAAWPGGQLVLGVFDWRGRLLTSQSVALGGGKVAESREFTWTVADHGVCVNTYHVQVTAVRDGKVWAQAATKFARHDRWSMRHEYQWSTWAGIACAPPSLVPEGMQLMAHAGMNALGYPGRSELWYPAERWGWRYYNEGVGMNTWGPVIEYENDAEIEAQLLKEAKGAAAKPDLASGAHVLASVGEEAGFKNGWGTRYYWDTSVAPDKACRAFHWYLKTRYPNLDALNQAWNTKFAAWEDVKLAKEFSGGAPSLATDGWAHPKDAAVLAGANTTGVSLAPYQDTATFYNWYYDRIVNTARRILREQINPVTLTMSSAPTIGSADYDARVAGPGAWNESQNWSLMTGPEPGFGLIWGHFDWQVMTENMHWGFLLARSGHNNYWVDIPLNFNNDMTLTRSSMATRRWTQRFAGHERIVLDSLPAPSHVGIISPNGVGTSLTEGNLRTSLAVALKQGGFEFADATMADLAKYRLVFAPGVQAVSTAEAQAITAYVQNGGTFVFFPRFACQTPLGVPETTVPGAGLAAAWGLTVTNTVRNVPQYHGHDLMLAPLDGVAPELKGAVLGGLKAFRETAEAKTTASRGSAPQTPLGRGAPSPDPTLLSAPPAAEPAAGAGAVGGAPRPPALEWQTLAAYPDKTPAVMSRAIGKGRLVYVNAVYQSHWYIQWVTPTGRERQGFFRLVEALATQAGARRTLKLEGNLAETLHQAVTQFTDLSGDIRYVIMRTNGEVPWTTGTLRWLGTQTGAYDVLNYESGGVLPLPAKQIPLHLRPGAGRLLAFVEKPVRNLKVTVAPSRVKTGDPVTVTVKILGTDGRPVAGRFPLELAVRCGERELPGLRRSQSLASGGSLTLNTAQSDPAGKWTVTVTDAISGVSDQDTVNVTTRAGTGGSYLLEWGWPSEQPPPLALDTTEVLARLQQLTALYQADHARAGWMAKQNLCFYYDNFPGTRHAILRPLMEQDWRQAEGALRQALGNGAKFILTGEDLGMDPVTGLTVWPRGDSQAFEALAKLLAKAKWFTRTPDGDTVVAYLGKGAVTLCRESIDAAGHTNPEAVRWQQRWLVELGKGGEAENNTLPAGFAAPDAQALARWWAGQATLAKVPRTVTWFAGNQRELKVTVGPDLQPAPVVTLVVPPQGDLQAASLAVSATANPDEVTLDVGLDGTADWKGGAAEFAAGKTPIADLGKAVQAYLAGGSQPGCSGPYRDGSAWRLIPIRLTATAKADLVLKTPVLLMR